MARTVLKPRNDVYTGMLATICVAMLVGITVLALESFEYDAGKPAGPVSVTIPKNEPLATVPAAGGNAAADPAPAVAVPPPVVAAAPVPATAPPAELPPAVAAAPAPAPAIPAAGGAVPSPLSVPSPVRPVPSPLTIPPPTGARPVVR